MQDLMRLFQDRWLRVAAGTGLLVAFCSGLFVPLALHWDSSIVPVVIVGSVWLFVEITTLGGVCKVLLARKVVGNEFSLLLCLGLAMNAPVLLWQIAKLYSMISVQPFRSILEYVFAYDSARRTVLLLFSVQFGFTIAAAVLWFHVRAASAGLGPRSAKCGRFGAAASLVFVAIPIALHVNSKLVKVQRPFWPECVSLFFLALVVGCLLGMLIALDRKPDIGFSIGES